MFESVHPKNVHLAAEMTLDLAPRLNLIASDNGLGKSFLLDMAWRSQMRTWAHNLVIPRSKAPSIAAELRRQGQLVRGDA